METIQITVPFVKKLLPKRSFFDHKGSVGKLMVIAGSYGLSGAAKLCSQSALKAGGGVSTLFTPEAIALNMDIQNTEVMTVAMPQTKRGTLSPKALIPLLRDSKAFNAVAVGPGISKVPATARLMGALLMALEKRYQPMVIDADAIRVLKPRRRKPSALWNVVTPHQGELADWLHLSVRMLQKKGLIEMALKAAKRFQKVVVLKGSPTHVVTPEAQVFVLRVGNPGMATAGSGDVLTGVIGSFLAARVLPLGAAIAGAYVHGLAGDMAREAKGEAGMTATDIMENLPQALRYLTGR